MRFVKKAHKGRTPRKGWAHKLAVTARSQSRLGANLVCVAVKGVTIMQLDKKSLERLLRLNDDALRGVLGHLLAEYGVDAGRVPLATLDMSALRAILSAATDEDISRFLQLFAGGGAAGGQS